MDSPTPPTTGSLASGSARYKNRPGVPAAKPTTSMGPATGDPTGLDDATKRAATIAKADAGDMGSAALVSAYYGRRARFGAGQTPTTA